MTEGTISSVTAAEEYSRVTKEATDTTSWRPTDVKHKKNEVFVDVVETMNVCISAKGDVLRADVDGRIFTRAYLSGTPQCKLVLNDKPIPGASILGAELYDCRFHRCVHSNEFYSAKTISFIPPDGEFQLMSYRCTPNVELPIEVFALMDEIGTAGVSYIITIKTRFYARLSTSTLVVKIPTPVNTANVGLWGPKGDVIKAKYVREENMIVWKIPKMQGGSEARLYVDATLTSTAVKQVWAMPPIDVDFQIQGFTLSGWSVMYFAVTEKSNYHSANWMRHWTEANGSYQVRL